MQMPNTHMIFRDAVQPGDPARVQEIVDSTGFFRADEIKVAVELVTEKLAQGAGSSYRFQFAEISGVAIGYTCYGEIPCTIGSYDLYWIAVHEEYRKSGIGRQLLAHTEASIAALGGRAVYIETASCEKYQPTRHFYTRNNYDLVATLNDYYSPGDDKLIYVKILAPGAKKTEEQYLTTS